jgi:hypothetical protein
VFRFASWSLCDKGRWWVTAVAAAVVPLCILQDKIYSPDQLTELMSVSDYVVAATPYTPATDKLISAAAIAAMKPNGVFVNVGRGKCVDEEALIEGERQVSTFGHCMWAVSKTVGHALNSVQAACVAGTVMRFSVPEAWQLEQLVEYCQNSMTSCFMHDGSTLQWPAGSSRPLHFCPWYSSCIITGCACCCRFTRTIRTRHPVSSVAVLRTKRIRGAGLDVFATEPLPADSPLWDLPNVFMSPHNADRTKEFQFESMELFVQNVQRYMAGEELMNVCDKRSGY